MATSSIYGADIAPTQPSGRDADALGPSDNSDTGADAIGTHEARADTDSAGTGERGAVTPGVEGREGGDILPDRIVGAGGEALDEPGRREDADVAAGALTDIDADDAGTDAEGA